MNTDNLLKDLPRLPKGIVIDDDAHPGAYWLAVFIHAVPNNDRELGVLHRHARASYSAGAALPGEGTKLIEWWSRVESLVQKNKPKGRAFESASGRTIRFVSGGWNVVIACEGISPLCQDTSISVQRALEIEKCYNSIRGKGCELLPLEILGTYGVEALPEFTLENVRKLSRQDVSGISQFILDMGEGGEEHLIELLRSLLTGG